MGVKGVRGVWLAKAVRQRTLLLRDEVLATSPISGRGCYSYFERMSKVAAKE